MVFFDCKLCGDTSIFKYICPRCNRIKDIINIYSLDTVLDTIESVLIRTSEQQKHKIEWIKSKDKTEEGDNTYIKKK